MPGMVAFMALFIYKALCGRKMIFMHKKELLDDDYKGENETDIIVYHISSIILLK